MPVLSSYLDNECIDCRNVTVCSKFTCVNIKKSKVKKIVFEAALNLSTNLAEKSRVSVDPCFIIDAVNNYKLGVDYRNQYLTIERGEG